MNSQLQLFTDEEQKTPNNLRRITMIILTVVRQHKTLALCAGAYLSDTLAM